MQNYRPTVRFDGIRVGICNFLRTFAPDEAHTHLQTRCFPLPSMEQERVCRIQQSGQVGDHRPWVQEHSGRVPAQVGHDVPILVHDMWRTLRGG